MVGFSGLLAVVSLVCWIIVLVDAFQSSVWKGLAALLCGLYWLFYALFEFQHEYKWVIVILALIGGGGSVASHYLW